MIDCNGSLNSSSRRFRRMGEASFLMISQTSKMDVERFDYQHDGTYCATLIRGLFMQLTERVMTRHEIQLLVHHKT
jgi:hypothetical protein